MKELISDEESYSNKVKILSLCIFSTAICYIYKIKGLFKISQTN